MLKCQILTSSTHFIATDLEITITNPIKKWPNTSFSFMQADFM